MNALFAQMDSAQALVMLPILFLPLPFQFAHQDSALSISVRLLPLVLVLVLDILLNGAPMPKLGYYMPWFLCGRTLALAGLPVAQVKALPSQLAQAVALIGVGQVGGLALALTILNSLSMKQVASHIAAILPDVPCTVVHQAISGVQASMFADLSADQRERLLAAIVHSVDNFFVIMNAAAGLWLVLAVLLKWERLYMRCG
ncbi:hypothetical protein BO78DRAFT_415647 [Aspergillus sclerotiicarbonarius CBS 121057]|uniref:MFS general substrate transporter n=1 Tax=Aspergillus sclerotiicarbonarius (strain CBS 121057 / IBT 28362) TaxID=1448318 RepID=A0A319F248_ASPSB|nr:hypothetical protein BO78DRAFT_415647 [Aspergillus sclerotiicarbonarius CBS 121057]